ncbi:MAG: type VI secretion system tip protein TssI/VgrG, partial [Verrucomicrobiota bacterium]
MNTVLGDAGLSPGTDFRQTLGGTYDQRTYVAQYDETQYNFVNRLMEQEGIHYYFTHGAGGSVMEIIDDNSGFAATPNGPFSYYGHKADAPGPTEEHIRTFHLAIREFTDTVQVRNFDSGAGAVVSGNASTTGGEGEYYSYGPHPDQTAPADLNTLASHQLGALRVARTASYGTSTVGDLKAGHTFTLNDTTGAALGLSYVALRVRHAGFFQSGSGGNCFYYGNDFIVSPTSVTYRPEKKTPKPTIEGLTSGTVTGPGGSDVHTDSLGRVKVAFHWDRSGITDEDSSGWIRPVQSPHQLFLPRVGSEVLIAHLNGDIDRPVVIGTVYNGAEQPPYALPDNATRSTIRTETVPANGTYNEIRFE